MPNFTSIVSYNICRSYSCISRNSIARCSSSRFSSCFLLLCCYFWRHLGSFSLSTVWSLKLLLTYFSIAYPIETKRCCVLKLVRKSLLHFTLLYFTPLFFTSRYFTLRCIEIIFPLNRPKLQSLTLKLLVYF